jgi:CDP-glucose 4,6-dehydratase
MTPEFWRGKRVFMTGHTGFKGSWLSLWLQQLNADLTGYALGAPTNPNLFEIANVSAGMRSIIGDIRDFAGLTKAMQDAKPDIVIHMAAQPLVRYSYQAPVDTYATNVMGTVHMLEAVRHCGSVRAVVNVTTDKCYQNQDWVWGYRENEPMGGYDPYSSSKGCAELVSAAYRKSFLRDAGIAMATARAGNVVGGGDWALDRLIPDILRALEKRHIVQIRNPNAIRPWQHVLEPLSGYMTLAENLHEKGQIYADGWNFGPRDEDARPVKSIVENLCTAWGDGANWKIDQGNHQYEASYLKLDISKAVQELNWSPKWSLDKALNKITEWHQAWMSGQDMHTKSIQQIQEYTKDGR